MFDYYGSKNSLARKYQYPRYNCIVEPFAGSAGYSVYHLSRNKDLTAILCDKSEEVVNAWKRLKEYKPEDLLNAQIPKVGETTNDFFVKMSSTSNAAMKCKKMTVSKMMAHAYPVMMKRMARLLRILPRIEVIHGSYEDLQDIEATWFVDPPYQRRKGSSCNGDGYAKGCRAVDIDFQKLGDWCKCRKGQCIVCEKEGADWLPFRPFAIPTNSLDVKYTEVVWTSLPDLQMEFDFGNNF